jgi:hypothetical protein
MLALYSLIPLLTGGGSRGASLLSRPPMQADVT